MRFLRTIYLALLCLAVLFTSCSEDEAPSGNTYTLTVSEEYDDRFEFVAFITDETGEVLDQGKTKPGKSLTLYAPEDYTGLVNFHYSSRITYTSGFSYNVITKPDVPAGWQTTLNVGEASEPPSNVHTLDVSDISPDYDIMRYAGPTVRNIYTFVSDDPGPSHLFFSYYETGPITYILQTQNSGSPRYLHISEPDPNNNYYVDFTDFLPVEAVNFDIGMQADNITAGMSALFPQGKTSGLGSSSVNNTDHIDLYYYPENIFPAYITYITATIDDIKYTYRKHGNAMTQMHWLDAEISSLDISGNTLTATTTGLYGQFYVSGDNQWWSGDNSYYVYWVISMKEQSTQTVALPDVITVLKKYWDELEGGTINLESGTISQSSLIDNVGEVLSVEKGID